VARRSHPTALVNLFDYQDYRLYLRDFYHLQKQRSATYSYRAFAQRAKLASPNYLKLVIDGARRVTEKNLPQFVRGLKLTAFEAEYFRHLVLFQESQDSETQALSAREMTRLRTRSHRVALELDRSRHEYFKHWHHVAIREMVMLQEFRDDPEWIARRLGFKISPLEAQASLELLLSLGFVQRERIDPLAIDPELTAGAPSALPSFRYSVDEPLITTIDETTSQLIRGVHKQFIELGSRSLNNDSLESREVSSLTLAVAKSKIPAIKKALRDFRKELNRAFSEPTGNEEVYHLLINFFPLTQSNSPLPLPTTSESRNNKDKYA
jgi:hypothetical protein